MALRLSELAAAVPGARLVSGAADIVPTAVTHDSRRVVPGALFVSLPGRRYAADAFVPQALARGASAVVSEREQPRGAAAWLAVPHARQALAELAAAFHGYPSERLRLIGVTGTDGKTTTTRLIAELLEALGHPSGWYTTADLNLGAEIAPNTEYHTTPEADRVQEVLAAMVAHRRAYAVLEASSHALAQERLRGCAFDVGVFTNLSPEHLDYHGSVEEYRAAKARLFAMLGQGARPLGATRVDTAPLSPFKLRAYAVLNADDAASAALREACAAPVRTYGLAAPADVQGHDMVESIDGLRFTVQADDHSFALETRFLGRFNAANWLAAVTVALAEGITPAAIQRIAPGLSPPPGRLERIACGQPFSVFVDFAHTPQALRAALAAVRAVRGSGRVLLAFGQAEGRTVSNRAVMGAVAAELADRFVITSDDASREEAARISADIADGARAAGAGEERFCVCIDRREALRHLLREARPGDIVLLAGKGHERTLRLGDVTEPWGEAEVARALLGELGYRAEPSE